MSRFWKRVPSEVITMSGAHSEVEFDVESLPVLNPDNTINEHSRVEEDMPIVDLTFGAAARAALQGLDDVDLEAKRDEISTCVFCAVTTVSCVPH